MPQAEAAQSVPVQPRPTASPTSTWSAFPGDEIVPAEGGLHVHDPTVLQFDERFFCLHTTHDGFRVMRSSLDLDHWIMHEPLLSDRPEWLKQRITEHRAIWAPDVIRGPKRSLRMYYCASEKFGWNTSYIGLAVCEKFDPTHPSRGWRDCGPIVESRRDRDNFNAIDPEVIIDEEGRHWMFFGSYWSGVYVVELDPAGGKLLHPDNPQMTLVARNTEDPRNAIEGAACVFRDGYYYLFASYGLAAQGVRSDNRVVVCRSNSVTGPYVDRNGRSMLDGGHTELLSTSPPMFSPGHSDVFQDESGRWMLSYHFYDARRYWTDDKWGLPTLQIRDLIWSDDGWPLPGLPVHRAPVPRKCFAARDVAGAWIQQVDFAEPKLIEIRADRTVSAADGADGIWSIEGRNLLIRWSDSSGHVDPTAGPQKFQLAHGGTYYVGHDRNGKVIRGVRLEARP